MSRKYVIFEAARKVVVDRIPNGDALYEVIETVEVVELNDQIINVYTADEEYVRGASKRCCIIKFIQRDEDGGNRTLNWHVYCTIEQAKRNMQVAFDTLNELAQQKQTGIEVDETILPA